MKSSYQRIFLTAAICGANLIICCNPHTINKIEKPASKLEFNNIDSISIIKLPEWYKGVGVIFPANYNSQGYSPNRYERFTPSLSEIKKAERILHEQYITVARNDSNNFASEKITERKFKNLKFYNRQYLGFYNIKYQKVVFIRMLDFSNKHEANKLFKGWQNSMTPATGDLYYKLIDLADINLDTEKLIIAGTVEK